MLTHLLPTNPLDLFLHLSLAGLLLLTLSTLLTTTLFRRSSAATRHLTWTATTLALLCLPAFAFLPPAQPDTPPYLAPLPRLAPLPPTQLDPLPSAPMSPLPTSPSPHLPISSLLLPLYALGLLTSLTPLLLGPLLLRRLRTRATTVTDSTLLSSLNDCRQTLSLSRPVTLLLSPSPTAMPLAFGLLRPHILLPADAPAWPPARLRLVLSHELAHIKRHDVLTLCLAQVARAIHWFNPLAYLAVSRMLTERERACDDLVLAATATRPSDYADTLLRLSTTLGTAPTLLPVMPMSRGPSHLHTRLRAILNPAVNRSPLTRRLTIAALLLAPALALPLSCSRADKPQPQAQPPIAGTQRVPGLSDQEVDQYGWTPEMNAAQGPMRDITLAAGNYANKHDGHLPPTLGDTLPYLDRNSAMSRTDRRHATPAEKARMYLDPRDYASVALPETPTPAWVNAHTSYTYLGRGDVDIRSLTDDQFGQTILLHDSLDHPHRNPKAGPLVICAYLDGHSEGLPVDTARKQIEASKQTLANAAKPSALNDAHPTPRSTPGQSTAQRSAAPDSSNPQSPRPIDLAELANLQSRILSDKSAAPSAAGTISRILSLQSDPAAQWDPAYGNFIESLRKASALSDADWATYLQHSSTIAARIRPNVRTGDPVPVALSISSRVGFNRDTVKSLIRAECFGSITFDNQPARPLAHWGNPWFYARPYSPFPITEGAPSADYAGLSPGPHTAHITAKLTLGLDSETPLALTQAIDLPFTLHPADHPTVRLIDDPALRDRIAHSILVAIPPPAPGGPTMFDLEAPDSPCALAYDVEIRSGRRRFGGSWMSIPKGSRGGFVVSPDVPADLPAHVDLILHPNPTVAAATVDITEICAGDITLPNISTNPPHGYSPVPALSPAAAEEKTTTGRPPTPGQSAAQRSAAPDSSSSIPQSALRNPQSPFPFTLGDSSFLPGDSITLDKVLDVTPAAVHAPAGSHTYQVTGTYTLASHGAALLAAEVNTADGKVAGRDFAQIEKGKSVPFSLNVTVAGPGYPHVSFYAANYAFSFGVIYFGSGGTALLNHNQGFSPKDPDPTAKEHVVVRTVGPAGQRFTAKLDVDGKAVDFSGISPAELPLDCRAISGTVTHLTPAASLWIDIAGDDNKRHTSFGVANATEFSYEAGGCISRALSPAATVASPTQPSPK